MITLFDCRKHYPKAYLSKKSNAQKKTAREPPGAVLKTIKF